MNTLKKFSVETHKGWASFQAWIKKWNKIMAVIFSALGITLLLSAVIVNALEVHEDNQKENPKRHRNENPRRNLIEVCRVNPREACLLYCSAGASAHISKLLSYHWEENLGCHSTGISIMVSSTVHFPRFTITPDWLSGNFKLKELHIDMENIFEICQNAFAGAVFEWMQKLVLINVHLLSMDSEVLIANGKFALTEETFIFPERLFAEQHFKYLTITKKLSTEDLARATVELSIDSTFYSEINAEYRVRKAMRSDEPILSGNMSGGLMISLTIAGCTLSFTLGLFFRHICFYRKVNKMSKKRMIFVIENEANRSRESVNVHKT